MLLLLQRLLLRLQRRLLMGLPLPLVLQQLLTGRHLQAAVAPGAPLPCLEPPLERTAHAQALLPLQLHSLQPLLAACLLRLAPPLLLEHQLLVLGTRRAANTLTAPLPSLSRVAMLACHRWALLLLQPQSLRPLLGACLRWPGEHLQLWERQEYCSGPGGALACVRVP